MALPPMPSQASQLPRALQQPQVHHQHGVSGPSGSGQHLPLNSANNGINIASMPRRRVSYLIPPPPASQPPPLLMLPTGSPKEIRARKRGNPNPLIMLANPDALNEPVTSYASTSDAAAIGLDDLHSLGTSSPRSNPANADRFMKQSSSREGRPSSNTGDGFLSTSFTASSSSGATSTSSRHYHSNNTTVQRHPEHTLGITALALDTSTIIDNSISPSRKKTPAGILYSGGRDGLVASWELALPFKKRETEDGSLSGRKGRRKRYLPRWAEDTYADDDLLDEDDDEDSSSDEETAGGGYRKPRNLSQQGYADEDGEAEELLLGDSGGIYAAPSLPGNPGSSPRLRLDTSFGQSGGLSSGLQLDLNSQRDRRRRSVSSSYKRFSLAGSQSTGANSLPYENRWRLDTEQLEAKVSYSLSA